MIATLEARCGAFTAWLVGSLAGAAVLTLVPPVPDIARAVAVLLFVLLAPGAAIAGLLGVRDPGTWAAVTLGGSLTVGVLSSEAAALVGWWQPRILLIVLAVAATAAALLAARRDVGRLA